MLYDYDKIQECIKLLELPNRFDFKILKKFYKKSVLKYHPDIVQNQKYKLQAEEKMKEINNANAILKKLLEENNGYFVLPKKTQNNIDRQKRTRKKSKFKYKSNSKQKNKSEKFYFNIGYLGLVCYLIFMLAFSLGKDYLFYGLIFWIIAIILFVIGLITSILRKF